MSGSRRQLAPLDPREFGPAFARAVQVGQSPDPARARQAELATVQRTGGGSTEEPSRGAYARAFEVLREHFGSEPRLLGSAYARFVALLELYTSGVLRAWSRPGGAAGREALHPAVLDVASRLAPNKNGRFPPRKFVEEVERVAARHYPHRAEWAWGPDGEVGEAASEE